MVQRQQQRRGVRYMNETPIAPDGANSEPNKLLAAAYHALRSYQYGNGSTELAQALADDIGKYLASIGRSQ